MQAQVNTDVQENVDVQRQFCSFILAGRLYGVDIIDVKEISSEISFTPIPHSPQEVLGYVNIRGQVHLVLDLRLLLGLESDHQEEECRLVIFKPTVGESFGVMVDKIGDVIEVTEDEIEDRRQGDDVPQGGAERRIESGRLVKGVCKLSDNLLIILNARGFLDLIQARS